MQKIQSGAEVVASEFEGAGAPAAQPVEAPADAGGEALPDEAAPAVDAPGSQQ